MLGWLERIFFFISYFIHLSFHSSGRSPLRPVAILSPRCRLSAQHFHFSSFLFLIINLFFSTIPIPSSSPLCLHIIPFLLQIAFVLHKLKYQQFHSQIDTIKSNNRAVKKKMEKESIKIIEWTGMHIFVLCWLVLMNFSSLLSILSSDLLLCWVEHFNERSTHFQLNRHFRRLSKGSPFFLTVQ